MGTPEPNTIVAIDHRGRATVEMGGVKMVGVIAVSGDHGMDQSVVTIQLSGRFVSYEQRSSSVDGAISHALRQIDYALKAKVRDDQDRQKLISENQDLRHQLAARARYRVPCGRSDNGASE